MCMQNQVVSAVRKPLEVFSFPIVQVQPHRAAAVLAATRSGSASLYTETIHTTNENGFFVSATALGGAGQSMITGLDTKAMAPFFLGGALAAIGSAILPSIVDVGINLIKKVITDDELAAAGVPAADVAILDAVLSVSDPNVLPAPVAIGRYSFTVTPTAILANPAPFSDGVKLVAAGDLPSYLAQIAPCLAGEAGRQLFELAKANLGHIDGFNMDALTRFLKGMLAGGGEAMVKLIQNAAVDCL